MGRAAAGFITAPHPQIADKKNGGPGHAVSENTLKDR